MEDLIKPRRRLGTGRYDRKLIERMVELSVSDNYEDASKEWMATGKVYWGNIEVPEWWQDRAGSCLCGHKVVYHFEVKNSENDEMILVGSDHINSYHILRQIALATGMQESMITDEMIDEWMKVKVASMMQTAWWHTNGELFTEMFDAVKEYDVRVNVRVLKWQYDAKFQTSMPLTAIRKGSSGSNTDDDYKMASIVWRWNHPDNPKAQVHSRGYPTDKLMADLFLFNIRIEQYKAQCEKEDSKHSYLLSLKDKREQYRQAQLSIIKEDSENIQRSIFAEVCDYYNVPNFYDLDMDTLTTWERGFVNDIKRRFTTGNHYQLSSPQLQTLGKILSGKDTPATYKQLSLLDSLGYEGEKKDLGKKEASALIGNLLATKAEEQQ
tara:strand:+ start:18 stop:1160 length:1143 start_codon:yes stop_codon:yes gene_type:complete